MRGPLDPLIYDTSRPVESWWEASAPPWAAPAPLAAETATEVAIIGGGYAGLACAIRLAELVQEKLRGVRNPKTDRGVRQAPMDVLMGPVMPAVLVEVGFVDHPTEGLELLQSRVRSDISNAGLQVSVVQQPSATAEPGTVLAQSPRAGDRVKKGSLVTITVATAAATPTPTATPTATPTPTPTTQAEQQAETPSP